MSFYDDMKATASGMIAEFGQPASILRRINSGPKNNPQTNEGAIAATIVVEEYANREVDGTRVLRTDKKVLLANAGVEPDLSDRLLIGGVPHVIVSIMPEAPGGVTLMWTLQCRR